MIQSNAPSVRLKKGSVKSIHSLRKAVGKVSPILVTLTSPSDSDFESSNVSLKEKSLMALIRSLTISTTTFERMKEKFDGFRQTVG